MKATTQYSINTKSYEIYLSGCKGSCKGCHNTELKDFNIGEDLTEKRLFNLISDILLFDTLIDNIFILGGEPLDQNISELEYLLSTLKKETNKKIWLFTRYELNEIPQNIIQFCDYIKTGHYDETQKGENIQFGISLPTTNQKIYKIGGTYV